SATWQFAAIAGPAAGGLILGYAGMAVAYGTAAALLLLAWYFMATVASRPPLATDSASGPEGFAGLMEGVRFVKTQPVLLGAITLDLFSVLFAGAEALLPVFASDILHVGAQ